MSGSALGTRVLVLALICIGVVVTGSKACATSSSKIAPDATTLPGHALFASGATSVAEDRNEITNRDEESVRAEVKTKA